MHLPNIFICKWNAIDHDTAIIQDTIWRERSRFFWGVVTDVTVSLVGGPRWWGQVGVIFTAVARTPLLILSFSSLSN